MTFEECLTASQQENAQKPMVVQTRRQLCGISSWEVLCMACFVELPEDDSGPIECYQCTAPLQLCKCWSFQQGREESFRDAPADEVCGTFCVDEESLEAIDCRFWLLEWGDCHKGVGWGVMDLWLLLVTGMTYNDDREDLWNKSRVSEISW